MQCFWLHRQKQEAGGEGPVLIMNVKNVYAIHLVFKINVTHIYSIPFIIAENVGLVEGEGAVIIYIQHVYAICFCSSPKMWGFWLHRQKQEAGGEGPVSHVACVSIAI